MKASNLLKITLLCTFVYTNIYADSTYEGSRVDETWDIITENPYKELFETKVNMDRFLKWGDSKLSQSANRTINDKSDILPYFEKLVHANGVCLLGKWEIDTENEYSGYFKNGSSGMIIARASVALSDTTRGNKRSFGFAGKIFPTNDLHHLENVKTANFFTMDDLGGTKIKKYTDGAFTNEPKVSISPSSIFLIRMASFVSKVFKKVDSNPGLRQLWQISNLNHEGESNTPMWMQLTSKKQSFISSKKDFREEILENLKENGEVLFDISVTGKMALGSSQKKNFKRIGKITFEQAINSEGCDHRLHFNHPKLRSDLK